MAEPYMTQKDMPNYGTVNYIPTLPVYVALAPPPRRRYTFLKSFIVAVALLEISWFGYHWHLKHWHRPGHHIHGPGWDIELDMAGLDPGAEGCGVWDHYNPDRPINHITERKSSPSKRLEKGDKFSFRIPTSSERYHFVSWGQIDKSRFEVVAVESDKDQIVAEVEVLKDPRGTAQICSLPSSGEGETYGVGIYSPRHYDHPDSREWEHPAFKVTVFVPVSSDGSQRRLNAFETRLGQFEHVFPDLAEKINFSKLQLGAANVPITLGSLLADSIRVSNANGPITGNLTSGSELSLSNANSLIRSHLTLTQAGGLHVSNANGEIDATVHLKSGDFSPRPDYRLVFSNANAPVGIFIAEQPVGSGLFLKASNVNSPLRAHVGSAYEGSFKLSDVFRTPAVELTNRHDPTGRGRERYLQFDKRGSTTSGWIGWGRLDDGNEHAPGEIDLSNVMSPVELFFD